MHSAWKKLTLQSRNCTEYHVYQSRIHHTWISLVFPSTAVRYLVCCPACKTMLPLFVLITIICITCACKLVELTSFHLISRVHVSFRFNFGDAEFVPTSNYHESYFHRIYPTDASVFKLMWISKITKLDLYFLRSLRYAFPRKNLGFE